MKPENKLWLKVLKDERWQNDRLIIKKMKDECYNAIARTISFEAITELHKYITLRKGTKDDTIMAEMLKAIEDDAELITEWISGYRARRIVMKAEIQGDSTINYYYLTFGEYHSVVGLRKLFSALGQDYNLFYPNTRDPDAISPEFESVEDLVDYWKKLFYDKIKVKWPPRNKEWKGIIYD